MMLIYDICWYSFPGFVSIINTKYLDSRLQSNAQGTSARLVSRATDASSRRNQWDALRPVQLLIFAKTMPWESVITKKKHWYSAIGIIWQWDIYLHQGWAANEILWSKFSWQHCSPIGASLILALWTSLAAWSSSKFPFQIKPLNSL